MSGHVSLQGVGAGTSHVGAGVAVAAADDQILELGLGDAGVLQARRDANRQWPGQRGQSQLGFASINTSYRSQKREANKGASAVR